MRPGDSWKLWRHGGTGKGHADPSPSVSRILETQERDKKFADARVSADLPLPIVMNLDPQGPPVSYVDATSKLPKKKSVIEDSVHLCNVWLRDEQWDKEKVATQATLAHIAWQEQNEEAAQKKEEEWQSKKAQQHEAQWKLAKEGAKLQEWYNKQCHASGACPDPITDLLGWCEYTWAQQDKYEVHQNGLTISGAPALWITNS